MGAACGPGNADTDAGSAAAAEATNDTRSTDVETVTSSVTATSVSAACLEAPTSSGGDTDTTTDSGATETGDPLACPALAGQPCTAPIDCTGETCGSHVSAFDEHGCPRPPCSEDAECGAGEGCLLQTDSARPLHAVDCVGGPDACSCVPSIKTLVGVCVEEALLPDHFLAHCDTLKTAAACDRFDVDVDRYCRWLPFQTFCDGSCMVAGDGAACVGFTRVGDGCVGACPMDDAQYGAGQGYARTRPGGADLIINPTCGDEPEGWVLCGQFGIDSAACCMCSVE